MPHADPLLVTVDPRLMPKVDPKIVAEQIHAWWVPVLIFLGALAVGVLVQLVINRGLKRWAAKSPWIGAHVIARSVRGVIFLWIAIVGLVFTLEYGARQYGAQLSDAYETVVWRGLKVLVVASVTIVLARLVSGFLRLHLARLSGPASSSIFAIVSTVIVYLIGVLFVLQTLEIPITPLIATMGVGGLAVALAAQDTLANLFAGIHILIAKHVRKGDYVRLDGENEGFVEDIGWRNTSFRSSANNLVVVPNSKLASSIITNCSLPESTLVVKLVIGVAYDSDLAKVEAVTLDVAKAVMTSEATSKGLEPAVRFHTFAESSILFDVSLPVHAFPAQGLVKHRFVMALTERYRREGIVIPYPVRTVQLSPELIAGMAIPPNAARPT